MLISWFSIDNIFLTIDSAIYTGVAWLYEFFLKIAKIQIFGSEVYESFAQRIYVVLGIVMLFVLAYNLLKVIVNPDNLAKGDKSFTKVASNLVISLVIIGLLPTIFSYAYRIQNFILEKNIIGVLFFGNDDLDVMVNETDEEGNVTEKTVTISGSDLANAQVNSYGRVMAFTALNAFLNPTNEKFQYDAGEYTTKHGYVNTGSIAGCIAGAAAGVGVAIVIPGVGIGSGVAMMAAACAGAGAGTNAILNSIDYKHYTWDEMKLSMIIDGDFSQIMSLNTVLKEGAKSIDGKEAVDVKYTPFLSSICGLILLYLLFTFCFDLGIRAVQLAFLQLIAPIPIFMGAIPNKKDMRGKWVKKTLSTYLEVFIRVGLMYTAVYLLSNLTGFDTSTWQGLWMKVIVIISIIAFIKIAPKLFADITGIESGNIKLGILPKLAAGGVLTGAALLGGAATSGIQGLTHGFSKVRKNYNHARNDWGTNTGKQKAASIGRVFGSVAGTVFGTGTDTIGGGIRSGTNAKAAKNFKDVKAAASSGIASTVAARNKSEGYVAKHQNDKGKVFQGLYGDSVDKIKNWATGGSAEILDKVAYEDDLLSVYSDYENVYKTAGYDALDSQLNQYEAMEKSGATQTQDGTDIHTAINNLRANMRLSRLESISKNKEGAAYSLYNLYQKSLTQPELTKSLNLNYDKAADLTLKNGKILNKITNREVTKDEIAEIMEGVSHIQWTGDKVTNSNNLGLSDNDAFNNSIFSQKKPLKGKRSADINSIAYKVAKEAKDKSTKK